MDTRRAFKYIIMMAVIIAGSVLFIALISGCADGIANTTPTPIIPVGTLSLYIRLESISPSISIRELKP